MVLVAVARRVGNENNDASRAAPLKLQRLVQTTAHVLEAERKRKKKEKQESK